MQAVPCQVGGVHGKGQLYWAVEGEGPELWVSVPWQNPPAVPTFGMSSLRAALFSPLKPLDVHGGVASADSDGPLAAASPQEGHIEQVGPRPPPPVCLEGLQGSLLDEFSGPRRVCGWWS